MHVLCCFEVTLCHFLETVPWPRSSVQTPCPLVRAWSGLASPGLGVQRRPPPQWAVWTPQDAPFSRAQAMQQPQPDSRRTCAQSVGTAGHPASVSCVQAAQRMGSGSSTGDDLTEAKTARAAAAATSVIFSCNPGILGQNGLLLLRRKVD